ncbi:MAG: alpha/beta fold hydrolase [Candidatus Eisenbacteria bacterium]|nr:alpha/beta fold hydrolase [Candidatus Eisenbacteria bacterium]
MSLRAGAALALALVVCATASHAAFASVAVAHAATAGESGTFVVLSGSDTVAVEIFHRDAASIEGQLAFRLAGVRYRYAMKLRPDASSSNLEESVWRAADSANAAPVVHATVTFRGDSAIADVIPGGLQRIASAPGVVPFINPSVVMMERIVRRARVLGGDSVSVPVFLPSGGRTLSVMVRRIGADSTSIDLGSVQIRLATDAAGSVRGGSVPSQRLTIVRAGYDERAIAVAKPDYSVPPDAPYTGEAVRVSTPERFTLAGTLTRPRGAKGRVPAVVTITGSGAEDRDEALPGVRGYRPFRQIADALARNGIAVLRLDDRGFGESGGEFSNATTLDFANDIRAALAWLRARPDIDGARLALVGHSEGGLIAPLVAETDPRLRAIALMAGPSRNGRRILEYQNGQMIDARHPAPTVRDSMLRGAMKQVDSLATLQPWLKFFLGYDPLATAKSVRTPVLILQGATDRQVTADQASELESAFRDGGNKDVTMKLFANANHLFANDPSGDPAGYASLPERAIRADVLEVLAGWLGKKLKQGAAAP